MFTKKSISFIRKAQTDVSIIRIDFDSMQNLMKKHPDIADKIATTIKQRQAEHLRMQYRYSVQPTHSNLKEIRQYTRKLIRSKN